MRFFLLLYGYYFIRHSNVFKQPIDMISNTTRNDILYKWSNIYSYKNDYKYNKEAYDHLNETLLWTNKNTSRICYMIMGNKIYILEKPYSLDCDFLTLKKDL
jgi:hypothetical protein